MKIIDLDDAVELREAYKKAADLASAARAGPLTILFMYDGEKFTLGDIVPDSVVRDVIVNACNQYRTEKAAALWALGVDVNIADTEDGRQRPDQSGFMECGFCSSQPGSPTLCRSCLNNRSRIHQLSEK